jgi:hypothetical protein
MIRMRRRTGRVTAWALIVALLAPLAFAAGCGGGPSRVNAPPIDDSGFGYNRPMGAPVPPAGMTTRQKLVTLAGAAAHNSQPGVNAQNQYYLSRNGRVYYRDANGQAHWVTPPKDGIRIPENEAAQYRHLQGYEFSSTGRDLTQVPEARM